MKARKEKLDYEIIIKDNNRGLEIGIGMPDYSFWAKKQEGWGFLMMDVVIQMEQEISKHLDNPNQFKEIKKTP